MLITAKRQKGALVVMEMFYVLTMKVVNTCIYQNTLDYTLSGCILLYVNYISVGLIKKNLPLSLGPAHLYVPSLSGCLSPGRDHPYWSIPTPLFIATPREESFLLFKIRAQIVIGLARSCAFPWTNHCQEMVVEFSDWSDLGHVINLGSGVSPLH